MEWDAAARSFLCPCHDSSFDAHGARTSGPAERGLDNFPRASRPESRSQYPRRRRAHGSGMKDPGSSNDRRTTLPARAPENSRIALTNLLDNPPRGPFAGRGRPRASSRSCSCCKSSRASCSPSTTSPRPTTLTSPSLSLRRSSPRAPGSARFTCTPRSFYRPRFSCTSCSLSSAARTVENPSAGWRASSC